MVPEPEQKSSTRARTGGGGSVRSKIVVITSSPPPANRPGRVTHGSDEDEDGCGNEHDACGAEAEAPTGAAAAALAWPAGGGRDCGSTIVPWVTKASTPTRSAALAVRFATSTAAVCEPEAGALEEIAEEIAFDEVR